MKRICAWCLEDMGTKDEGDPDQITHSICPKCKDMIRKERKELEQKPALIPLDTYDLIEH